MSPYPVGWLQYLYNPLRLTFVNLNLLVDGDITGRRREIIFAANAK